MQANAMGKREIASYPAAKVAHLRGFTLLEMVMGIVAFSVVMTIIIGVLAPQATRSADPIFQVRATELAQSLFNEISAKSFDENSDRTGGNIRCGDDGAAACTLPANLGPDSPGGITEDREDYNDVDDYHGLSGVANSFGSAIVVNGEDLYAGYSLSVEVMYDADFNGVDDNAIGRQKMVRVTVTMPNNESMVFRTYRSNF